VAAGLLFVGCASHETEVRPGEGLWHVAERCTETDEARGFVYGALVRVYGENTVFYPGDEIEILNDSEDAAGEEVDVDCDPEG
jgi:hypothetical protein